MVARSKRPQGPGILQRGAQRSRLRQESTPQVGRLATDRGLSGLRLPLLQRARAPAENQRSSASAYTVLPVDGHATETVARVPSCARACFLEPGREGLVMLLKKC